MSDKELLEGARFLGSQRFRYFAVGLQSLNFIPHPRVPSIAIDRTWRTYYNSAFVSSRTPEQLMVVVMHEFAHRFHKHHEKQEELNLEPRVFQIAACMSVNSILVAERLELPHASILPEALGFPPLLSALEDYERILAMDPGEVEMKLAGGNSCGSRSSHLPAVVEMPAMPGDSSAPGAPPMVMMRPFEADLIVMKMEDDLDLHSGSAPGFGSLRWNRFTDKLENSEVDWTTRVKRVVRRAITLAPGKSTYTMTRFSRRQGSLKGGVRIPALVEPVLQLSIVCDTSGSMHQEDLDKVMAELKGVLKNMRLNITVRVIIVDSSVHSMRTVTSVGQVRLVGGGGTEMSVGIQAALAQNPKPDLIIVMTDGLTSWPQDGPSRTKVIVMLTQGRKQVPSWVWETIVLKHESLQQEQ